MTFKTYLRRTAQRLKETIVASKDEWGFITFIGVCVTLMLAAIVILVLLCISIVPMVILFIINTIAHMGGSDFYIAHTVMHYVAILGLLLIGRIILK